MQITKFTHSCLLVETPGRTTLFDPGCFSTIDVDLLKDLDDIFITHGHPDHLDTELIKKLVAKFPDVHVTTTPENVVTLKGQGITASTDAPEGVSFFDSPHEVIRPFYPLDPPQEIGVHYLGLLSHPGDSHSFSETKAVLALPVQAPWGSVVDATKLALELKPKYVIPIHDWHWNDQFRQGAYDQLEKVLGEQGITFIKTMNGQPFTIDI